MDAPRIQFTRTSDDVSIAFWTMGSGPPLFLGPPIGTFSHIALEPRFPPAAALFERLAAKHTLIRYDPRNYGMSQRGVERNEIETVALDAIAVADALSLDRFDVVGFGALPVIAAVQPSRVRRLVLGGMTSVRAADSFDQSGSSAVFSLAAKDWIIYTETLASFWARWSGADIQRFAAFMRECLTQEDMVRLLDAWHAYDVSEYLSRITAPTLVLSAPGSDPLIEPMPEDRAGEYAARIKNARLVRLDGDLTPISNPAVLEAIEQFLDEEPFDGAGVPATAPATASGMAVILFADIVDSTALTERIGDAAFYAQSEGLHRALREALASCGGRVVEGRVLGDGIMAVFDAAKDAIAAASAAHGTAEAAQLQLHVGIHAGDVIRDANDVHGGAVNIAARIAAASGAGQTLVSDVVRSLGRTSAGVVFEDRGEFALKGIEEAQRLFAVRARV